jgi:GTP-binding protein
MIIKSAEFVISNTDIKKLPAPNLHEYAFIGRSNVGKSSLINMLTGRKKLAKTSSTPGKTQTINHFIINDNWYLTDLPGYGYAKVSKTERAKWSSFIQRYLKVRENLVCLFVLIDSRIKPQAIDLDFMDWCGKNEIPFVIVMTKTDKISSSQLKKSKLALKKAMEETWEFLPDIYITSSNSGTGKDELLRYIDDLNKSIKIS